jgi:hypothetical protein
MVKTVDAASSAMTGSFGVIATIVDGVRPCRRGSKLMNFRHFSGRLADEQLQFPVIFPLSREFATGFGRG